MNRVHNDRKTIKGKSRASSDLKKNRDKLMSFSVV